MIVVSLDEDFDREWRKIDSLVYRGVELPKQVFRSKMHAFRVIDFDEIWSREFFFAVRRLTAAVKDSEFILAVMRPDPREYFFKHFGTFPLLRFCTSDLPETYLEVLQRDPGGSPADAVAYNSDTLVIYPASLSWIIYGDRGFEIAVVAVRDEDTLRAITPEYLPSRLFSTADAIRELLPPVYRGAVPQAVSVEFLANYESEVGVVPGNST